MSRTGYVYEPHRRRVICKNGASLSVQANDSAYSTPREIGRDDYTHAEVGFIQDAVVPESWLEYANDGTLQSDIFCYVPLDVINDFIESNGGVDWIRTFNQKQESFTL